MNRKASFILSVSLLTSVVFGAIGISAAVDGFGVPPPPPTAAAANPVWGFHALCTWDNKPGAKNNPRGLPPLGPGGMRELAEKVIAGAVEDGLQGIVWWMPHGYTDSGGQLRLDAWTALKAAADKDPRLAPYAVEADWINLLKECDANGLDKIVYVGGMPPEWNTLATPEVMRRVQDNFSWAVKYVRASNNDLKICIDDSNAATTGSRLWFVVLALRGLDPQGRIKVGCEPSARVGSAWLTPGAREIGAFSVITAQLQTVAAWSTNRDGLGWYPVTDSSTGRYAGPGTEYVLCVGPAFDKITVRETQSNRGSVPVKPVSIR